MKPLNVLSKFENHFVNQTVRFQVQLEAGGYFLDLPYFFLHPAESDVFSKVRVCEAKRSNESPSGAFKRQNGLAQQDGGASPRQVPFLCKGKQAVQAMHRKAPDSGKCANGVQKVCSCFLT